MEQERTGTFRDYYPVYSDFCQCQRCVEIRLHDEEDSEDEYELWFKEDKPNELWYKEKTEVEKPKQEMDIQKEKEKRQLGKGQNDNLMAGYEPPNKKFKRE